MREATGELNLSVVVVILVVALLTLFFTVIWPKVIKQNIVDDENCQKAVCNCGDNCRDEENTGFINCTYKDKSFNCAFKG